MKLKDSSKILLGILLAIVIFSLPVKADTLFERDFGNSSYSLANSFGTSNYEGNSFTIGASGSNTSFTLTKVSVNFSRTVGGSGITLQLYNVSAGIPTGNAISTGTNDSAIGATDTYINFTMNGSITLIAGQKYVWLLKSSTGTYVIHQATASYYSGGDAVECGSTSNDPPSGCSSIGRSGEWEVWGNAAAANLAPSYFNITTNVTSPQTFPISTINFSIKWNDTDGPALSNLSKAWVVHDFNGTNVTYFMSNNTANDFYYFLNGLSVPAGSYTYQFFANDTSNATNQTNVFGFVVNKASTTLALTINGTAGDVTYAYLNATNLTASKTIQNGNITLYRNGTLINYSSTLNLTNEINLLGAGFYNYTTQLSHTNYTASQLSRYLNITQIASGVTLNISPSTSISEGTSSNVSCSANSPLSVSITKDGTSVPNPSAATLSFGVYNYTCTVSDLQNYTPSVATNILTVSAGGFGCTNYTTFAFTQTISANSSQWPMTLNFTSLVNQSFVRSDLADVYVNTSLGYTVTKNTTNGFYYVIVNNTTAQTNFTVQFGNYISNNSYSDTTISSSVTNISSSYSQLNDYYYLTYYNELNGTKMLPPNSTSTQTLYCNSGTSSFTLANNTTRLLVPSIQQLNSIRTNVLYSATSFYYRDYVVRAPVEFKNIYLVDALTTQVLQDVFKLNDYTGQFGNGTIFEVKTTLGGSSVTVTELKFDAEAKSIAYLINGGKYQIFIDNGIEVRGFGDIYPDPSSLIKSIAVFRIADFNVSVGFSYHRLNFTSGTFNFIWFDPSNQTTYTSFNVYNLSNNGSLVYTANSTNVSSVNFVYASGDTHSNFKTSWDVKSGFYGNNSAGGDDFWGNCGTSCPQNILLTLITGLGGDTFWFIAAFVMVIPMMFSRRHIGTGAFIFVGISALFLYWGWWALSATVIGLGLLLAILIETKNKKRWND